MRSIAMHRADELSLAWALADSAAAFVTADRFALVCVKIGAGELQSAIATLLDHHARFGAELPDHLAQAVQAWLRGYRGTDEEPKLGRLAARIRVAAGSDRPAPRMVARCSPVVRRAGAHRAR
ncbi:hypothetical protein MPUL_36220 [Mycolicibacterium pulveris]|uniref:Uncharacterized protein n=2 Tax=Mycolicibacterium pulveris TaxID=36813 RepID=A0A7I7ULV7_MYCPV|nr:hypothetical protein MPUL_36220 [Mycolicibacterium pulveris]